MNVWYICGEQTLPTACFGLGTSVIQCMNVSSAPSTETHQWLKKIIVSLLFRAGLLLSAFSHIIKKKFKYTIFNGLGPIAVDYVFTAYQIVRDVTMKPYRSTMCVRWPLDQQFQPHLKTLQKHKYKGVYRDSSGLNACCASTRTWIRSLVAI